MNAASTIPVVEIHTPTGVATLVNAKIVNIAPPATIGGLVDVVSLSPWGPSQTTSPGTGSGAGAGRVNLGGLGLSKTHRKLRNKWELTEVQIAFESITLGHPSHKKGKAFSDNWSIPG